MNDIVLISHLVITTEKFVENIYNNGLSEKPIIDLVSELPLDLQVEVPPSVPEGEKEPNTDYSKWFLLFELLISNIPDELKTHIQIMCGVKYIDIWFAITVITVIAFLYLFLKKNKMRKRF